MSTSLKNAYITEVRNFFQNYVPSETDSIDIIEKIILPLRELEGRIFNHKWQIEDALAERSVYWRQKENDKNHNAHLGRRIEYICKMFRFEEN